MSRARRIVDIVVALGGLTAFAPLLLFVALLVRLTSKGPILHWSERVGVDNTIFIMPKFRTMRTDAPLVATHLLRSPETYLTTIGGTLRKFSLDELPQLVSILKGHLTLIGPRPALFNQHDLIELRTARGIDKMVPGLTGWAQVNGRDNLTIEKKVAFEHEYLQRRSIWIDLRIIYLTVWRAIRTEDVLH